MSVVSIESGDASGKAALVSSDGSLQTAIQGTVRVEAVQATVATSPQLIGVGATFTLVARTGRRELIIQNLDPANSINARLAAANPNANDLQIFPGEKFVLSALAPYEGEVRVSAPNGAQVLFIELYY